MGRLIETQTIGFICNVSGCRQKLLGVPIQGAANWRDHAEELAEGIAEGWVAVLSYRIRTYCPNHARFAYACSCRGSSGRMEYCLLHNEDALKYVWDQKHTPLKAQRLLPTTSNTTT